MEQPGLARTDSISSYKILKYLPFKVICKTTVPCRTQSTKTCTKLKFTKLCYLSWEFAQINSLLNLPDSLNKTSQLEFMSSA